MLFTELYSYIPLLLFSMSWGSHFKLTSLINLYVAVLDIKRKCLIRLIMQWYCIMIYFTGFLLMQLSSSSECWGHLDLVNKNSFAFCLFVVVFFSLFLFRHTRRSMQDSFPLFSSTRLWVCSMQKEVALFPSAHIRSKENWSERRMKHRVKVGEVLVATPPAEQTRNSDRLGH